jgi:hypothetical protein
MNIESEDLDAAITAGVVTQAQADALRTFVTSRNQTHTAQLGSEDEHFRFMRGFNDFFFAIGILLFGFGIAFFAGTQWATNLVAAAIIWAMSEYLVRKMRLVLPGILLSLFFVLFAYRAVPVDLTSLVSYAPRFQSGWEFLSVGNVPQIIAARAPVAALAAALYYWRFRLPFTLLPIAGTIVMTIVALATILFGPALPMNRQIALLVCGLIVFAAAMSFDVSDRERRTRRSDCAFWLHLLAAPLIVHSVISLIASDLRLVTGDVAIAIVLIVIILAAVAIVIDRRAMLVSALLYVGVVVAYAIRNMNLAPVTSGTDQVFVFFSTLVILGMFVIALGVGWQPLRRLLMRLISPSLAAKLPPAQMSV